MTEGLATGASRQLTAAERGALQEFNAVLRSVGQQKILAQSSASLVSDDIQPLNRSTRIGSL